MTSASLYLSANVIDRLTKPLVPMEDGESGTMRIRSFDDDYVLNSAMHHKSRSGRGGGGNVMDAASFMGSLQSGTTPPSAANGLFETPLPYNTPGGRARPASAPKERHSLGGESVGSATGGSVMSSADKMQRVQKFKEFLTRQNQQLKRKELHVDETRRSMTPVFKPAICPMSQTMTDMHFKGNFMERVNRDVTARANKESKLKQEPPKDANCTFRPRINKSSESLRPRSAYELSKGDLLKRDSSHKLSRLRNEASKMEEATFQPAISSFATRSATSVLNRDPAQYLIQCKQNTERKRQQQEHLIKEQEEQVMKECTFKPKTTTCPAYIMRIANSMKLVRAAKKSLDENTSKSNASMAQNTSFRLS